MKLKILFAYLAVSIIWGTGYLSTKIALPSFPPFWLTSIRFFLSGMLMLIWCLIKRYPFPDRPDDYVRIGLLSILFLVVGNGFLVWSQQVLSSGLVAIICAALPLWMAFFTIVTQGYRKTGIKTILGLISGFSGMVLLVYPKIQNVETDSLISLFVLFLATVGWALGSFWMNKVGKRYNVMVFTALEMLIASGFMLIAAFFSPPLVISQIAPVSLVALSYLVLVASCLAFTAFFYLFSHANPVWASTYAYINPVIAVYLGWLILHEPLSWNIITGALIVLSSVAIVNWDNYKKALQQKNS